MCRDSTFSRIHAILEAMSLTDLECLTRSQPVAGVDLDRETPAFRRTLTQFAEEEIRLRRFGALVRNKKGINAAQAVSS